MFECNSEIGIPVSCQSLPGVSRERRNEFIISTCLISSKLEVVRNDINLGCI